MTYVYNSQLDAFTLYHAVREESAPRSIIGPALPALGHATSGALGTAVSKLITYPLDLLITRLQVQKQFQSNDKDAEYQSVLDAIQKVYANEGGISAFYSGVVPETIKGVADSFLFFLAYTYARQQRLAKQGTHRLSTLDEIGVGVLAGAFAKFWTTPLQNIVIRKQSAAMIAARESNPLANASPSTRQIAYQIRQEKGLQGFWSGYSASFILTLNPSITFLLQGVFTRLLVPRSRRSEPGVRITFLIAAVSKAMASTLTYPFSLAKTRAQISSQKPTEKSGPTSETEKPDSVVEEKALHARQRTVFSTIIRIAQTEGVLALYQGLGAEILKAFFSHGITMLAKERIHTLVINLYYLILQSLKKYPSPEELGKMASDQAKDTYAKASDTVKDTYAKSTDTVNDAYAKASDTASGAYSKASEQATNAYAKASDTVKDTYAKTTDTVNDAYAKASDTASGAYSKASVQATNAYAKASDQAKETYESASNQAQNTYTMASNQTKGAYAKGAEVVGDAATKAQDAISNGRQQAGDLFEQGKDATSGAVNSAGNAASKAQETLSNTTQQTGEYLGKSKDAASAAVSDASKQAQESFIKADVKDINGPDDS